MKAAQRKSFLTTLFLGVCLTAAFGGRAAQTEPRRPAKMIGMYVHQHWPYNHPYAARTWTLEDWRGYADGMTKLGCNAFLIWPMLETMPDPLTPSDRASLSKLGKVIEMLHETFGMKVYIVLCPNIGVDNKEASKATFEKRHFYYCAKMIDPNDPVAFPKLIQWREQLLRPLANVDGVAIIDSDPGGYPGSTNAAFVHLLAEHRKMLDRVRPGIELVYWMHAGWQGWSRLYETGKFAFGTPEEQLDVLTQVKALAPEPYGIANGLPYAEKLGIAAKVIRFNYGLIEAEPSFPLTNFTGETASKGAAEAGPRGVMGNAQTHCVQLPNTFAFMHGAQGLSLTEADYVAFADDLILRQGERIVRAWKTLAGTDAAAMRGMAEELAQLPDDKLTPGRLKGLLFGSPRRFVTDLVLQLRMRAALMEFVAAVERGQGVKAALGAFIQAAQTWQHQTGYQNMWWDPKLHEALRKLHSPAVNRVLDIRYEANPPFTSGHTPAEQVEANFHAIETYTPQLLAAMNTALRAM